MAQIKVLVIDNDKAYLKSITNELEQRDCRVFPRRSAVRIKKLVFDFEPDVVLIDWYLDDGEDGSDAARLLREHSKLATLPVILLSEQLTHQDAAILRHAPNALEGLFPLEKSGSINKDVDKVYEYVFGWFITKARERWNLRSRPKRKS